MAVSNSKNFKNKALTNDRFDLQDYGGKVFEFQTLIENAPVMILIFQDCGICYANPMTKILTGYNQDELLTDTNLRSQLQLHQQRIISDCGNHGATQRQEVRLSTKNGKECWLDCSLRVIQFAKKPAISIVAVDITKHKQAEQKIQQVLEQEKKLVSMVSHELRTPLNVISLSSKLLKSYGDRWKPSKVRKYLERLQRGVDTLSLLIDEWLILGKIDTGKLKFEPKPFNLEQFCDNLLSDLQLGDYHRNLHSNNCKLGERSPRQINFLNQGNDSLVNLDRRILQLILTNLLENALKYSPEEKEIDFTVACHPKEIIFKIKDRGMGIKECDQPQLFQPFYRGENVDNIPGNGLGLAIVKKLVDLSGGQINVESQLGIGTEFVVSFPKSE